MFELHFAWSKILCKKWKHWKNWKKMKKSAITCDNLRQPAPTCDNLWQPATTCDNLWQPATTCPNLRQLKLSWTVISWAKAPALYVTMSQVEDEEEGHFCCHRLSRQPVTTWGSFSVVTDYRDNLWQPATTWGSFSVITDYRRLLQIIADYQDYQNITPGKG